jgi:hypothetical protein
MTIVGIYHLILGPRRSVCMSQEFSIICIVNFGALGKSFLSRRSACTLGVSSASLIPNSDSEVNPLQKQVNW